MPKTSTVQSGQAVDNSDAHLRRFAGFATFAAIWTYALIVFGGIVRISGSGMGCGDHWPKCNGHWIPPFTIETLIEYTHRVLGVSIGLVLIGVFVYAFLHRRSRGFSGPGGLLGYAGLVLTLVVVQGLLGAITVWFEIPPAVVVVHFANALLIMGILIAAGVRARSLVADGVASAAPAQVRQADARAATLCAALGFAVVVLGALVANNLGAPQACQGFPLCNGSLLPHGGQLVQIHWTHRLFAFGTFFFVLYQAMRTWQRHGDARVRASALIAGLVISLQVLVAAGLVLMHLPHEMQALHLAVGAAVWATLVLWASVARSASSS